jgi:hypothetical protein
VPDPKEAHYLKTAGWVRTVYGLALLARPGRLVELVAKRPTTSSERTLVRVLGLRETVQSLACAQRPTSAVLKVGAGVDALHATTMLVLAIRSAHWRRPALVSAAVAATYAVIAFTAAEEAPRAIACERQDEDTAP